MIDRTQKSSNKKHFNSFLCFSPNIIFLSSSLSSSQTHSNIEEGKEYRFFLHRHWSLFDAMSHSPYIASKLRCWNAEGMNHLQELLAKMGVPLHQCNQKWDFITPSLRSHFHQQISSESTKAEFNLKAPDVLFDSFWRCDSFCIPVVHHSSPLCSVFYTLLSSLYTVYSSLFTFHSSHSSLCTLESLLSQHNSSTIPSVPIHFSTLWLPS
jgi:hypothetical protein